MEREKERERERDREREIERELVVVVFFEIVCLFVLALLSSLSLLPLSLPLILETLQKKGEKKNSPCAR